MEKYWSLPGEVKGTLIGLLRVITGNLSVYISAIVQCSGPVKSCLVRSVVQCLVELQYLEVMRVQLWLLNLLRSLACFFFPLLAECCQRLLPLAALMFPQGVYVTLHKYFSICLAGRIRRERAVSANISTAFLLNALLKLLVSFIVHTANTAPRSFLDISISCYSASIVL